MENNEQNCLFCGCKTHVTQRKTGQDFVPSNEHEGSAKFYYGKVVSRYRFQVICNKCKARGPLMKSEQEARDAYKIHTTTK